MIEDKIAECLSEHMRSFPTLRPDKLLITYNNLQELVKKYPDIAKDGSLWGLHIELATDVLEDDPLILPDLSKESL